MMNVDLVEKVKGYVSPDMIRSIGMQLGETSEATRRGLNSAIPAVMGGFARQASSDPSGAGVEHILAEAPADGDELEELSSVITNASKTDALIGQSQAMLGDLFGDRLSSTVDEVATRSGVGPRSAGKILAVAAPLVGAVVRREADARHLSAGGLASMLAEQNMVVPSSSHGSTVTNIFDRNGIRPADARRPLQPSPADRTVYQTGAPEGRPTGRPSMPLILLAALAVLAVIFTFTRRRPMATAPETASQGETTTVVVPPGTPATSGPGSAVGELNRFFEDPSATTPKRIPLQELTFDHDSNLVSAAGLSSLAQIAAVLEAHPSANVRIDGYADDSGDSEYDRALSTDRANAVRDALVREGVDPQRISVVGHGADNPAESNDTEQGRADHRRIELVVVAR